MQIATLPVAKHPRQLEYLRFASGQQFLAGEFRRCPQVPCRALPAAGKFSARRMQVGLIARRNLQDCGFDLGKTLLVEPRPDSLGDSAPRHQEWLGVGVPCFGPPRRNLIVSGHQPAPHEPAKRWLRRTKSVCCSPKPLRWPRDALVRIGPGPEYQEKQL